MPTLGSLRQVSEVETRFLVSGEAEARRAMDGVADSEAKVARGAEAVAVATEKVERAQLGQARAAANLRGQLDETFRAQQRYEASLSRISRFEEGGYYTAQVAADLRAKAFDRAGGNTNDNVPGRRGLDSNQRRDLLYQGGDVVASLGSGAGLGTVAFQQGPQIIQGLAAGEGGLRGGLKALGESALGLVTPFSLAATAAVGTAAAFGLAAKQAADDRALLERSTQGLGRGTGATVGDLDALAKANAEAGRISTSAAREIVASYASTGQIAIPVIGELTRVTSEYARLVRSDVPAATAELAQMFSDPARGAEDLAAKIGGLSDRTAQLIRVQIEQGDRSAAQQTLADSLKATIDANAAATTGWAAAWNAATTAAMGYWEAAKRIAGIKLGIAPEGAQATVDRLNKEIENANQILKFSGREPLGLGSEKVRQRDAAMIVADTERRQRDAEAAQARAEQASRAAGQIARAVDPNFDRLSTLRKQQSDLRDALADPLARRELGDLAQTESAYLSVTRAIGSLTDANGKLISSEEMARRQDQLRLDSIKAKTEAEKASVAKRQKAFDLIGKTIEPGDARGQIARAGQIALATEGAKGGGKSGGSSDAADEYDRATKSLEDRIRRQEQEAATYGMGAEAVARYRAETDLLTAAKRAERDITPALTAEIQGYADKAGAAAAAQEKLRDSMRGMDDLRASGRDVFGGVFRDLSNGTNSANLFANALGRIQDRLSSFAADSFSELIFGKRGSSDTGILGGLPGLFSAGSKGGAAAGGLGGIFASIGSVFGFANGGIMGPNGPLPLRAYSAGGIADSPQLALFGEGQMKEAYVPLPDGRRIPVAMQGGGVANSNSVTDARSFSFDMRGSTLTEQQAQAMFMDALAQSEAKQSAALPGRMRDIQRRAA